MSAGPVRGAGGEGGRGLQHVGSRATVPARGGVHEGCHLWERRSCPTPRWPTCPPARAPARAHVPAGPQVALPCGAPGRGREHALRLPRLPLPLPHQPVRACGFIWFPLCAAFTGAAGRQRCCCSSPWRPGLPLQSRAPCWARPAACLTSVSSMSLTPSPTAIAAGSSPATATGSGASRAPRASPSACSSARTSASLRSSAAAACRCAGPPLLSPTLSRARLCHEGGTLVVSWSLGPSSPCWSRLPCGAAASEQALSGGARAGACGSAWRRGGSLSCGALAPQDEMRLFFEMRRKGVPLGAAGV